MKKIVTLLMVLITVSIFSTITTFAADNYTENVKTTAKERTDVYALDFYKNKAIQTDPAYATVVAQAKSITAGLTDSNAKVQAIHDFVSNNVWYDNDLYSYDKCGGKEPATYYISASDVLKYKRSVCEGYANLTVAFLQTVGIPAKKVISEDHALTEYFINGKWCYMDTTKDSRNWYSDEKFESTIPCTEKYINQNLKKVSVDNLIKSVTMDGELTDANAWTGSLTLVTPGVVYDKVLKEVKNYTIGGLVTSTYGFNANNMYSNLQCTKHWVFATDKVDATNHTIYIKVAPKTFTVTFNSQGGTAVKSVTVNANSKVAKPATNPTRTGCKFVGWYKDSKCTMACNFGVKITANTTIFAGWKK